MGNRALLNRINEIKELQNMISDLENQVEALKDQIKADMNEKAVDEITIGGYVVRYKDVESSRFDATTFKKTYAELYKQFSKSTISKRFSIN